MKKLHLTTILAALLLLPLGAHAESNSPERTIAVEGNSVLTVPAEKAAIHAQLKVVSDSVEKSYQQVVEQLIALTERMKKFELEKADVTVSAITQGAEYTWSANTRKLAGYSATCSLRLDIDHIEDSYKIFNELSTFSDLTILRTEFGLKNLAEVKAKTLQTALQDAKIKAQFMANSLDTDLGMVLTITEMGNQPVALARSETMMADAPGARNPANLTTHGTVTISSKVAVTFELK